MSPSKTFQISEKQLRQMLDLFEKHPSELFLSGICRRYLAVNRWIGGGRYLKIHDDLDEAVMPGSIEHNRNELEQDNFGSYARTARLINPLTALNAVYSHANQLKVLSIGPRTEMEVLHLIGVGFRPENISAIDLISSSPLIDVGDMHNLPYTDQSFDVVISSWVLGYSSAPQRAVDEMTRVCADNGVVAIGLTYEPGFGRGVVADNPGKDEIVGSMYGAVDELKALIGDKLDYVYFQQEPESADHNGPVMLIARIKRK